MTIGSGHGDVRRLNGGEIDDKVNGTPLSVAQGGRAQRRLPRGPGRGSARRRPPSGRSLARAGLRGVQLVISDDHTGSEGRVTRILGATWQRCRVHFARNLLAHAGKQGRRVVSAFVATAFAQEDADSAKAQWRAQAQGGHGRSRARRPRLHELPQGAPPEIALHKRRSNGSMPRSSAAPTSSPLSQRSVVGAILRTRQGDDAGGHRSARQRPHRCPPWRLNVRYPGERVERNALTPPGNGDRGAGRCARAQALYRGLRRSTERPGTAALL